MQRKSSLRSSSWNQIRKVLHQFDTVTEAAIVFKVGRSDLRDKCLSQFAPRVVKQDYLALAQRGREYRTKVRFGEENRVQTDYSISYRPEQVARATPVARPVLKSVKRGDVHPRGKPLAGISTAVVKPPRALPADLTSKIVRPVGTPLLAMTLWQLQVLMSWDANKMNEVADRLYSACGKKWTSSLAMALLNKLIMA